MSEINVEIGKKIRNFRKNQKMTIEELAKLINKSKATVSKYEKGEIIIDIVTLYEIAVYVNLKVPQNIIEISPRGNLKYPYDKS